MNLFHLPKNTRSFAVFVIVDQHHSFGTSYERAYANTSYHFIPHYDYETRVPMLYFKPVSIPCFTISSLKSNLLRKPKLICSHYVHTNNVCMSGIDISFCAVPFAVWKGNFAIPSETMLGQRKWEFSRLLHLLCV